MAKEVQKDGLQQLKLAIRSKKPESLYVFYGEETFLMHHYLGQLRKMILEELTESFNFHRFNTENFDLRDFADAVENLPMMSQHTLVQVEDIDLFKMPEADRSKILDVVTDIPEYCTLIFVYETQEWKPDKRLKKLWDALSTGQIVEFAKQDQRDLISWITRHFIAKGKRISPDLCAYLIEITDGTMTALSGEIEKISAFSGAETICKADIDAVTEPVLDAVVFRMTDMIAAEDYGNALLTLQKLLKMQEKPTAILSAVGSHLRRLGVARTLLDRGGNAAQLKDICSVADFAAKKAMESARRFRPEFFRSAMELVVETDMKMKTSYDDNERLLEMLILKLAQEARCV